MIVAHGLVSIAENFDSSVSPEAAVLIAGKIAKDFIGVSVVGYAEGADMGRAQNRKWARRTAHINRQREKKFQEDLHPNHVRREKLMPEKEKTWRKHLR